MINYLIQKLYFQCLIQSSFGYIRFSMLTHRGCYDLQNYPNMEFDECISLCVAKLTKKTGWLFPLVVEKDPKSDLKVLDANRSLETVFKNQYNRSFSQCQSKCRLHRKCDQEFTYYVTISTKGGSWPGLSFWIRRTDYPETKIEFLPEMRLCDLILEAGNILGIWLGLCVLNINPFKLLKKRSPYLEFDAEDEEIISKLASVKQEYLTAKELIKHNEKKYRKISSWN